MIAASGTLADVTAAVAALTSWERGRKGGVILDHHGYDGIARLTDAMIAAGQHVTVGTVH